MLFCAPSLLEHTDVTVALRICRSVWLCLPMHEFCGNLWTPFWAGRRWDFYFSCSRGSIPTVRLLPVFRPTGLWSARCWRHHSFRGTLVKRFASFGDARPLWSISGCTSGLGVAGILFCTAGSTLTVRLVPGTLVSLNEHLVVGDTTVPDEQRPR